VAARQWPACAKLATEIGGSRRGEPRREERAVLEVGREAWPCGIHPTVVGRLAGMKRRGILGQWLSVLEYWS